MEESFPVDVNGKRYDLKQFLHDHPGGVNTLKYYRGRPIADAMKKFGHNITAFHLLNDFKVSEDLKDSNLMGNLSASGRLITNDESDKDAEKIAFLEELEGRLDWSQPLLSQLDKVAPDYQVWVNSPVYRTCRLFSSPLLEALTYTPWFVVPGFWIPVILYLALTQLKLHVLCADVCTEESLTSFEFVYHLAFGVCLWTILEYSLHRWVFHMDPGDSLTYIKINFLIHGLHHKTPFDGLRQVFPPVQAVIVTSAIYFVIALVFSYPTIKLAGGLAGYLAYDLIHYYVHNSSPADGSYLYDMKRYHSNHHFVNHLKAFGISSKIWDLVFGTVVKIKTLNFSLQW